VLNFGERENNFKITVFPTRFERYNPNGEHVST
jgi:hypothetical protein